MLSMKSYVNNANSMQSIRLQGRCLVKECGYTYGTITY